MNKFLSVKLYLNYIWFLFSSFCLVLLSEYPAKDVYYL